MGIFARKDHFPVQGRTVLITGGSQGMGRGVARLLAQRGANVVLIARNVDKLKAAVEYMRAAAAKPAEQRFHHISADLRDPSECERVLEEVKAWNDNRSPDIVWCVAGSAYPDLFIHLDAERLQEQMSQNYFSTALIAHATLRQWLQPLDPSGTESQAQRPAPAPKHIIFTSSIAAFFPIVGYSAYAPAKAALRALSDVLSQELKLYSGARKHKSGMGPAAEVRIHNIFPGTIYSPGLEQENLTKPGITSKIEEDDTGQTEDQVAAASLKGLERGEYLVTTTFVGSILRGAMWGPSPRNNRLLDTLMAWLASIFYLFVQPDIDGKVAKWGAEHGHPVTYKRET